ncbi:hypothetical protein DOLIC_00099 [Dolichomitus sp. PSUC_FEM 10030005]|nr:hypothetical protein [Dolichomitus sp. PSUC_FEM 10030005]
MNVNNTLIRLVMEFKEHGNISPNTIAQLVNKYSAEAASIHCMDKNEIEQIAMELAYDEDILAEFRQENPSLWQLKRLITTKFANKKRNTREDID